MRIKIQSYADRLTLIAIILKLNYNMDTVSEELADHLMRLVQEIEHNPHEFTPRSVEIQDDELEVPTSNSWMRIMRNRTYHTLTEVKPFHFENFDQIRRDNAFRSPVEK